MYIHEKMWGDRCVTCAYLVEELGECYCGLPEDDGQYIDGLWECNAFEESGPRVANLIRELIKMYERRYGVFEECS